MTLDGMTDAQLDDLVARATATKAANAKRREDAEWVAFTPVLCPDYTEARVNRRTGETQFKSWTGVWREGVTTSPALRVAVERVRIGAAGVGAIDNLARAATALANAGGVIRD